MNGEARVKNAGRERGRGVCGLVKGKGRKRWREREKGHTRKKNKDKGVQNGKEGKEIGKKNTI